MLILGDKELQNNTVTLRTRSGEDVGTISLPDLVIRLQEEINLKKS